MGHLTDIDFGMPSRGCSRTHPAYCNVLVQDKLCGILNDTVRMWMRRSVPQPFRASIIGSAMHPILRESLD